jgi:hypothetical protein
MGVDRMKLETRKNFPFHLRKKSRKKVSSTLNFTFFQFIYEWNYQSSLSLSQPHYNEPRYNWLRLSFPLFPSHNSTLHTHVPWYYHSLHNCNLFYIVAFFMSILVLKFLLLASALAGIFLWEGEREGESLTMPNGSIIFLHF